MSKTLNKQASAVELAKLLGIGSQPIIGALVGAQVGKSIGKLRLKSLIRKSFRNRLRYLTKGSKKDLVDKYTAIGASTGGTAGALSSTIKGILVQPKFVNRRPAGWKKYFGGFGGGPSGHRHKSRFDGLGGLGEQHSVNRGLKNLGIEKGKVKSKADLKKAYRSKAKQHHPDHGGDAEKFKDISSSYSEIKKTQWFDKLSHAHLSAMRDEFSKIASKKVEYRAYAKAADVPYKEVVASVQTAWGSIAKTAFALQPPSTQPLSTAVGNPLAQTKKSGTGKAPSKNAGAPRGVQKPRLLSKRLGKIAQPKGGMNYTPATPKDLKR